VILSEKGDPKGLESLREAVAAAPTGPVADEAKALAAKLQDCEQDVAKIATLATPLGDGQ